MPLGPQFRNTFFTDHKGTTHYYSDPHTHPENVRGLQEGRIAPDSSRFLTPQIHTDASEYELGVPHQGMLFDPHTGTGLKQDPLIPEESRRSAIRKAFHIENPEEYKENARRARKPAAGAAQRRDLIEDVIHASNLPTHVIQDISTNISAHPAIPGRASGDYSPYSNQIRVKMHDYGSTQRVQLPPTTRVVGATAGAPIPNPNFSKMVNRREWDSDEGAHGDMAEHATFFDHTGAPYKMRGRTSNWNSETGMREKVDDDFRFLPEGHTANVWEGTGKDTAKYVTHTFKVYNGYNGATGRDQERTFHTRHERIGGTEETVPGKWVTKKESIPAVHASVIIHEAGHSLDPGIKASVKDPDPIMEGIAEGMSDRHAAHGYNYEEALTNVPVRSKDIESGSSTRNEGGYVTGRGSKWKTDLQKALHIAARVHTSTGDDKYKDIPGGNFRNASTDNHMVVLGHLYHHYPQVKKVLDHMGFSDIADRAEDHYLSSTRNSVAELREKSGVTPPAQRSPWQQMELY